MTWTVALTKPNLERQVGRTLDRDGFEFYLPIYRDKHRHKKLLLPRYVFVIVTDVWKTLFRVHGVRRVLMVEEQPAVIPDKYINALKLSEEDGVCVLANPFSRGQTLRVVRGQFRNLFVTYENRRTKRDIEFDIALVNIFGRMVRVEFEPDQLTATN